MERLLVLRITESKDGSREYKYAISNAWEGECTTEELVRMQSQRYFVERSFQEAKQEAGMSQYQVRGWLAWHHHMVMVMVALHFILSEKMLLKDTLPLLSAYDVREIMLNIYPKKGITEKEMMEQIHNIAHWMIFNGVGFWLALIGASLFAWLGVRAFLDDSRLRRGSLHLARESASSALNRRWTIRRADGRMTPCAS